MNYPWVDGDVKWTTWLLLKTGLLCTTGGVAAGFLGVGGGMVIAPVYLSIGMTPMVATTTATFMILFTSTSTTTQFIVFKRLQYSFALWYAATGFVSSIIGQLVLQVLIKKYGKQSYVAFFLAFVVFVSLIFFVVLAVSSIVNHNAQMNFTNPCNSISTTNSTHSTLLFF